MVPGRCQRLILFFRYLILSSLKELEELWESNFEVSASIFDVFLVNNNSFFVKHGNLQRKLTTDKE